MHLFKAWKLRDIILVALIGIFFGAIFMVTNFLYDTLTTVLAPFGLSGLANELLLGLWCMPGLLAAYLVRIPTSATIGELLAASVEALLGGQWGLSTLISGIVQGFGAELGFLVTGYKQYNWLSLTTSALTTTLVTFAWDLVKNGYGKLPLLMMGLYFVIRFLSMLFFGGLLTKLIYNLLAKTHVLQQHAVH